MNPGVLTLLAPAKLNLHLKVLGRRPDGMHELVTLMQPVSLADRLVLEPGGKGIRFTCDAAGLQEDNLVERAARLWYRAAGLEPGVALHLEKNIPVAAGLGGGSSDAAATLMGLNRLHGRPLDPGRLGELAARLGADVPFFLYGVTALCTGVGEEVEPWPHYRCWHYLLVNPGIAVSTARVYAELDLAWTSRPNLNKIYRPPTGDSSLAEVLVNDLEAITIRAYPELGVIKEMLGRAGARGVLMSGSGPTVFGVFDSAARAQQAAGGLPGGDEWWVCACHGTHVWQRGGEGQHGSDRS